MNLSIGTFAFGKKIHSHNQVTADKSLNVLCTQLDFRLPNLHKSYSFSSFISSQVFSHKLQKKCFTPPYCYSTSEIRFTSFTLTINLCTSHTLWDLLIRDSMKNSSHRKAPGEWIHSILVFCYQHTDMICFPIIHFIPIIAGICSETVLK